MKTRSIVLLLATVGACWLSVDSRADVPSQTARTLFHLSFEQGFTATSAGASAPTNHARLPELVEGIRGKAARFHEGQVLRYLTRGNLDKTRGTLSLWVQWPVEGAGPDEKRFTLLKEEGPNTRACSALWFWYHGGRSLRFDLRDPQDSFLYFSMAPRQRDEWHQVVVTWDTQLGKTYAYFDGQPAGVRAHRPYTPRDYEAFFLGAFTADGQNAWGAAIDEVTILDRPLTRDEVRRNYLSLAPMHVELDLADPFVAAGQPGQVGLWLRNPAETPVQLHELRLVVTDTQDQPIYQADLGDEPLAAGQCKAVAVSLPTMTAGRYRATFSYQEAGKSRSAKFDLMALAASEPAPADRGRAQEPTLVTSVDVAELKIGSQAGETFVVESPLGRYREAGPRRHDRFLVPFEIAQVDRPHLAVISYPDDKPRTMEVILQNRHGPDDYQAQTGVFTGDEYACSRRLLEHRVLFWPQSAKQAWIFMTVENGRPAAVKGIKIYCLDAGLPRLTVRPFQGSVPARQIGLYYEDPVLNQNFSTSPDLDGFAKATDRLLDYMQSFGQDVLDYPLVWYQGPFYGSMVEPLQPAAIGRPHPAGYPAYLLKRLHARGMKFDAGLHIHTLPSLETYAETDRRRIDAGEETVLNMQGTGKLFYGGFHGVDPDYNPADPRVQGAVQKVVDEILDRYGDEPAFQGVTLVLARHKLFTFGSIESGYNDINLRRFQAETGLTIPGYRPTAPDRFTASYRWLMDTPEAQKAWLDWRCRNLHAHYARMAERLRAKRPDLTLTLNLFVARASLGRLADYLAGPDVLGDVLRETGIDPALYANDPNIVLSYTEVPADLRWTRAGRGISPNVEDNRTAFMAPEVVASLLKLPQARIVIHDRYWEDAIGRIKPLANFADNPRVRECRWRVSTLNPNSFHSLEIYAAALNNLEALRMVKGGFLIGTFGMEEQLARFTQAYRALPAIKFDDVPALADPVRVRQRAVDGKTYFYVLNRLPVPLQVRIDLSGTAALRDPVADEELPAQSQWTSTLKPYDLRVFHSATDEVRVVGGTAIVPADWKAELRQRLIDAERRVATLRERGTDVSHFEPYLALAEAAWKQGHYARLHLQLQESWAAHSERLLEKKSPRP